MFDLPSIPDVQKALHNLPADLTIVDDAVDGSTWILHDGHLICSWDGSTGKSKVRLHLREVEPNVVGLELDQLAEALQFMQGAGFRLVGRHTVPPEDGGGRLMAILIFEDRDILAVDLREAIFWTLSVSGPAFAPRK